MPTAPTMPDLDAFKVVAPNADVRVEDLTMPDGTPMTGADGLLIPPARNFSMIVNSATRVYSYRFDEAMRDSTNAARGMRRDAFILGLLEERILPTINRDWALEVDDDRDPEQQYVRDGLTRVVKGIRNFDAMKRALLDAVWFGRAGVGWTFKKQEEIDNLWGISKFDPIHGDSVQFSFDGHPCIMMDAQTAAWYSSHGAKYGPPGVGDLVPTDRGGTALQLHRPYWRERYAIHQHILQKADYFEGEMAGSVQGFGLRGQVYWQYVVRTDALTWMLAYMQAVGQMDLLVFNYPAGNAAAKLQQEMNAQKIIGKAAIACPRDPKGTWPAVEQIPMNSAGLGALQKLVADYFDRHIERLIVGQSMSSGADKGTGLGGTGRADFARATKDEILVYDSKRLDQTLTYDLIAPLKKYNFPWAKFPVRFKSILPDIKAQDKVMSGKVMISVGVPIKADELREAAGYSRPEPGDDVVGAPQAPPGGPPGAGGAPPGPGGAQPPPAWMGAPGGQPAMLARGQNPTRYAHTLRYADNSVWEAEALRLDGLGKKGPAARIRWWLAAKERLADAPWIEPDDRNHPIHDQNLPEWVRRLYSVEAAERIMSTYPANHAATDAAVAKARTAAMRHAFGLLSNADLKRANDELEFVHTDHHTTEEDSDAHSTTHMGLHGTSPKTWFAATGSALPMLHEYVTQNPPPGNQVINPRDSYARYALGGMGYPGGANTHIAKFDKTTPISTTRYAEDAQSNTRADCYGTLANFHKQFGITQLPDRASFEATYDAAPVVGLPPHELVAMGNTSAHAGMVGKGIDDPTVIQGLGMGDQRHDSWQSVVHHTQHPDSSPIVVIKHSGKKTLLDGDHRVVAGALMNRPVAAKIVDLDALTYRRTPSRYADISTIQLEPLERAISKLSEQDLDGIKISINDKMHQIHFDVMDWGSDKVAKPLIAIAKKIVGDRNVEVVNEGPKPFGSGWKTLYERGTPTRYNLQDQRAFEEAIDANPLDGTTHGIYADWLDENNQPEEAAFRRSLWKWYDGHHIRGTTPVLPAYDDDTRILGWGVGGVRGYPEGVGTRNNPFAGFDLPVDPGTGRMGRKQLPHHPDSHWNDQFVDPDAPYAFQWHNYRDFENALRIAWLANRTQPTRNARGQAPTAYAGPFKKCSTQVGLVGEAQMRVLQASSGIPDTDMTEKGRETDAHITIRYGLDDCDPQKVAQLVGTFGPIKLRIGKASVFETPDADVLKFDVSSSDLRRLNTLLRKLPGEDKFPDYKPHTTVAYLKKGLGKRHAAQLKPLNLDVTVDGFFFCDKEGMRTWISTTGKPAQPVWANNEDNASDVPRSGEPQQYAKKPKPKPDHAPDYIERGLIHPGMMTETAVAIARQIHAAHAILDQPRVVIPNYAEVHQWNNGVYYPSSDEDIEAGRADVLRQRRDAKANRNREVADAMAVLASRPILADAIQDTGVLAENSPLYGYLRHSAAPRDASLDRAIEMLATQSMPAAAGIWERHLRDWPGISAHESVVGRNSGLPFGYVVWRRGGGPSGMRGNPPPGEIWHRPAHSIGGWNHGAQHKEGRALTIDELNNIAEERTAATKQRAQAERAATTAANRAAKQQQQVAKLSTPKFPQGPPEMEDMERLSRYARPQRYSERSGPFPDSGRGVPLPPPLFPPQSEPFVTRPLESIPQNPLGPPGDQWRPGPTNPQEGAVQPGAPQDSNGNAISPSAGPDVAPEPIEEQQLGATQPLDIDYQTPQAFAESVAVALGVHGRDEQDMSQRAQAGLDVVSKLPRIVYKRLSERLKSVVSHPDTASVGKAWFDLTGEDSNDPKFGMPEGFYDPANGIVAVNGEDPAGVFAHEMGHALDMSMIGVGGYYQLSTSREWQRAWNYELASGDLSDYAAENPAEGFAEFARLLYADVSGVETAARQYPKAFAAFAGWGFV